MVVFFCTMFRAGGGRGMLGPCLFRAGGGRGMLGPCLAAALRKYDDVLR